MIILHGGKQLLLTDFVDSYLRDRRKVPITEVKRRQVGEKIKELSIRHARITADELVQFLNGEIPQQMLADEE